MVPGPPAPESSVDITEVWADNDGWIRITSATGSDDRARQVHRAGLCVRWDETSRSFVFSSAGTWSLAQCYERIVAAVAEELGQLLVLTAKTLHRGIERDEWQEIVDTDRRLRTRDWTPQPPSTATLARWAGDESKRAQARERFRAKDWYAVTRLLTSIQYPDQLASAEIRMLELARARLHEN